MTRGQRAAQIWAVLAFAAKHDHLVTYGTLAKLIGVPAAGLGGLLEPIQSICIARNWPPLTALVVSESTGVQGSGYVALDGPSAFVKVFAHDWLASRPPTPEDFEEAVKAQPSNGVPQTTALPQV